MHKLLARQTRNLLGLTAPDLQPVLDELLALAGKGAMSTRAEVLLSGLPAFMARVGEVYAQSDRDLDLRARSLHLSSMELMEANGKLRDELASRTRAMESLRETANQLSSSQEPGLAASPGESLESLSSLMQTLVAQREIAAQHLQRSRERLVRAQRLAGMISWQVSPKGKLEFSDQIDVIMGGDTAKVGTVDAKVLLAHVVDADRERVKAARTALRLRGEPYQLEYQITRFDGAVRTVFEQANLAFDSNGSLLGQEGITVDITERKESQRQIRELENFDTITGLPNRKFFTELTTTALQQAQQDKTRCAVISVDIDRFKSINDAFGRGKGDEVLQILADRLRSWTRASGLGSGSRATDRQDALARVGSNSFCLFVGKLQSQEQAAMLAKRLLGAIAQPIKVQEQPLVLTASLGIALFPNDAPDLPGLLHCAEQAVYSAKMAGRASFHFFDPTMNEQAASRLLVESELRQGIDAGELRLFFQPKVDTARGLIVGAEALVRWQHPRRGMVPPNDFIPVAEETGLILPLTDWVLECTCRTLSEWASLGLPAITISVNLAAPSLTDATLIAKLDALMTRYNLAPAQITLEVTETMVMRDVEHSIELLQRLRNKGYSLSLDDFGVGYSSLSYLKLLTIDELKLDRSFVIECAAGGRDGALASAIIALGLELGLKVVAEGIETAEQSAFLASHGCAIQQGYRFSRPVPPDVFEAMLRTSNAPGTPI